MTVRALSPALAPIVALAVLGTAGEALAHKMKLFATAEGAVVTGYVYFSPGGQAQDAMVTAATPDGTTVFQGRTNEQGEFRFEALRRADHVIAADGGDGHDTRFTIRAAELPESLPAGPQPGAAAPAPPPGAPAAATAAVPAASPPPADLAALIEQAVARQVRPLREQLDAYEESVRWHDMLGGIGYIVGLAGLAYGYAARAAGRSRRRVSASKEETAR